MGFAALIPLAISGISALAGMSAAKKQNEAAAAGTKTTQDVNSSSNTSGSFANNSSGASSTMPMYDQLGATSREQLLRTFMAQMDPAKIDQQVQGQTNMNAMNINAGADAKRRILADSFSSRGLGFSPAAATSSMGFDDARIGQQVQNMNSAPLLRQQLMDNALKNAGGFFSSLPVGSSTTTSGMQQGTQQQNTTGTQHMEGTQKGAPSTDPWAAAGTNMAGMLAGFYGQGAFGGPTSTPYQGVTGGAMNPYEAGQVSQNINGIVTPRLPGYAPPAPPVMGRT